MKNKQILILGAAILSMVAGPVAYAGVSIDIGTPTVVVSPNTFAPSDDYVYYPQYNTYYSKHLHKYAYQDNGRWVAQAAPPNVSVDVLQRSPAVNMDFHDSPANHHKDIVQRYPKNWHADTKVDQRTDHPDDRGR